MADFVYHNMATSCSHWYSVDDQKRDRFEVKTLSGALEGVERLLLEVALIVWLPHCRQELT